MTEPVNLYDVAVESDPTAPAGLPRPDAARFGPSIGAEQLGGTVYELDPGDSVCPYHYEGVEEEWLVVLTGTPTLRDPEGEHELAAGDLVCFPPTADGAHKVTNRSGARGADPDALDHPGARHQHLRLPRQRQGRGLAAGQAPADDRVARLLGRRGLKQRKRP